MTLSPTVIASSSMPTSTPTSTIIAAVLSLLFGMLFFILLIVFVIQRHLRKRKHQVVELTTSVNKIAVNESGIYTTVQPLPLTPIYESAIAVQNIRETEFLSLPKTNEAYLNKNDFNLTSNEAYQTKNDFILTSNEAYQSKNDFILTSNEAYQSKNDFILTSPNEAYETLRTNRE